MTSWIAEFAAAVFSTTIPARLTASPATSRRSSRLALLPQRWAIAGVIAPLSTCAIESTSRSFAWMSGYGSPAGCIKIENSSRTVRLILSARPDGRRAVVVTCGAAVVPATVDSAISASETRNGFCNSPPATCNGTSTVTGGASHTMTPSAVKINCGLAHEWPAGCRMARLSICTLTLIHGRFHDRGNSSAICAEKLPRS